MKLTSLPAYSLTRPDKTVGSLCAYLVLSLLAPSILWNKMTSCNRQTWETAACVTALESTGALPMMLTSILSLSKQFNENAGIYWCAENHLPRLAIILYRVKEEPYPFVPAASMKRSNTGTASSLRFDNSALDCQEDPNTYNQRKHVSEAESCLRVSKLSVTTVDGKWKRKQSRRRGRRRVCLRSCSRLMTKPGSRCVRLTTSG